MRSKRDSCTLAVQDVSSYLEAVGALPLPEGRQHPWANMALQQAALSSNSHSHLRHLSLYSLGACAKRGHCSSYTAYRQALCALKLQLQSVPYLEWSEPGAAPPGLLLERTPQGMQVRLTWEAVSWHPVPASLLPSANPQSPLMMCPALISLPYHLAGYAWALGLLPLLLSPADAQSKSPYVTEQRNVPTGLLGSGLMCIRPKMQRSRLLSGSLHPPSGLHVSSSGSH